MKRDTIKTVAGLIIIGAIVVATFMYGNSQRKAQLAHDQEIKKQQEAKVAAATATTTPTASATATATAKPTTTATPTPNTAAVKSPATSTIQGSGKVADASVTPTPTATATATPTPTPVVAATTPDTGGTAPLPETGPATTGALGLGAIVAMVIALRRSRQSMLKAARTRR